MIDSKKLRDFTPEKAVFGGYDCRSVDTMLEQAAGELETLEQENAELRAKLKVMVDKIEDYRRIESGIRQALMTAQAMADKTRREAQEESEQLRARTAAEIEQMNRDAREQCEAVIRQYQTQAVQERAHLRLAQQEASTFIEKMTRAFREQSELIALIPQRVGADFASISDHTVHSETIEGRVEGPAELKPDAGRKRAEAEIPEEILKVFEDAGQPQPQKTAGGLQQTAYTVEVSGSGTQG